MRNSHFIHITTQHKHMYDDYKQRLPTLEENNQLCRPPPTQNRILTTVNKPKDLLYWLSTSQLCQICLLSLTKLICRHQFYVLQQWDTTNDNPIHYTNTIIIHDHIWKAPPSSECRCLWYQAATQLPSHVHLLIQFHWNQTYEQTIERPPPLSDHLAVVITAYRIEVNYH